MAAVATKSVKRVEAVEQRIAPAPRVFAEALADVYIRQRGARVSRVVDTAAEDLLALAALIEHDPNANVSTTVIRQLLEISEVLGVAAAELFTNECTTTVLSHAAEE